jgi:cytochrome c oxidase cbb3-type subunit I/II
VPSIASVKPYTPLELHGRDVYISEGCNNCHSQMVRPFRSETERYGEYSKAGESVYDHPHLWGSKRTGPDLAREGSSKLRKPNSWHFKHMYDPRSLSPGSIMPAYPWLLDNEYDTTTTAAKINAMITLGVPYDEHPYGDNYAAIANEDVVKQANEIVEDMRSVLEEDGFDVNPNKEIIALIAYLQRLGVDIETGQTSKK